MVFTDRQMLVPSTKSNEIIQAAGGHEMARNYSPHMSMQPVLQNENQEPRNMTDEAANKLTEDGPLNIKQLELFEEDDIKKVLEHMDEDKKELLEKLSQSDEDILQYLNSTMLENEPTEVLIKCAEILRERRQNLYPDQENIEN